MSYPNVAMAVNDFAVTDDVVVLVDVVALVDGVVDVDVVVDVEIVVLVDVDVVEGCHHQCFQNNQSVLSWKRQSDAGVVKAFLHVSVLQTNTTMVNNYIETTILTQTDHSGDRWLATSSLACTHDTPPSKRILASEIFHICLHLWKDWKGDVYKHTGVLTK